MRNDLTAMIYHDLRSPLSNIISSLDMLSAMLPQAENENIHSIFSVAQRSADRLQRLISSLLDINRLEAGQSITRARRCPVPPLVAEAREVVLPSAVPRSNHRGEFTRRSAGPVGGCGYDPPGAGEPAGKRL